MSNYPQVNIRCLCGNFKAQVHLKANIPVQTTICTCDSCRQTSGNLYWSCMRISISESDVKVIKQDLVSYNPLGKLSRYFCGKCGSHVVYRHIAEGDEGWGVCTGAIDEIVDEDLANKGQLEIVTSIEWMNDSIDGGLGLCFADIKMYAEDYGGELWKGPPEIKVPEAGTESKLYAACRCEGTEFYLTKPEKTPESESDTSKWWVVKDKHLGDFCFCRSCRLSIGQPIQSWVFVSEDRIVHLDGSLRNQELFGTLKRYESSPGVFRDFCGTCGASVFYYSTHRPGVTDVSAGLLRAPEGSLARSWVHWFTDVLLSTKYAVDKGLGKRFQAGLKVLDSR